ncbi:MAG: hypothetical protein WKF54_01145 [Nocardioidaceae bacterium]
MTNYRSPNGRVDQWTEYPVTGILPYDSGVLGSGERTPCAHPIWSPVAKRVIGQDAQALADLRRGRP